MSLGFTGSQKNRMRKLWRQFWRLKKGSRKKTNGWHHSGAKLDLTTILNRHTANINRLVTIATIIHHHASCYTSICSSLSATNVIIHSERILKIVNSGEKMPPLCVTLSLFFSYIKTLFCESLLTSIPVIGPITYRALTPGAFAFNL